ncbi:MAG: gamma-glutamylcyclotransferase [Verrucomicrobiota bacterium]|nr:gamma-glutamylcyclotransferase [Verrucomicrobiota bacterium]
MASSPWPSGTSSALFVYGTLMRGMENPFANILQTRASIVEKGIGSGCLYEHRDGYPCAVNTINAGDQIVGEIHHVKDINGLWRYLDPYEDCVPHDFTRSLFVRCVVPITDTQSQTKPCWMYFWNQSISGLRMIHGGDYRERKSKPLI